MKIAIAKPEDLAGNPEWEPFEIDFLTPTEIREQIHKMILAEEEILDSDKPAIEFQIITMNRTVIDLATSALIKNPGPLDYEDVFIWKEGKLVPLLDWHDEEWLQHFTLGDLFDRAML